MLCGALIKTTLADYPGKVACAWFLTGCSLRCPYCYNGDLVFNRLPPENSYTEQQVFEHLQKRCNVLSGFVISGGEALLHDEIGSIIEKAKKIGYAVKLDTNGMHPDKLEKLFEKTETTPDFLALDIKTSAQRYSLLGSGTEVNNAQKSLKRCIELCRRLSSTCVEYRTVLVPPLIKKDDIKNIASLLPQNALWRFAAFRAENCINPAYNDIVPYSESEMQDIVRYAQNFIPDSILR